MQVYLVGGAVRDALMGLSVKERDWVVVGSSPQAMLAQGYKQVGKDFPVFLHPKTKEEYALARTERKTGHGYDGFEVYASPHVTLKEDLLRRDLTINAIAQDQDGKIIDYFAGVQDLQKKRLRHVSEAFSEDPLRLLRLCRFQARFEEFSIAPETLVLCQQMVSSGEVAYLTPERVWLEWQKVFQTGNPGVFLSALNRMGAWRVLMPGFSDIQADIDNITKAAEGIRDDRLFTTLGWYLSQADLKKNLSRLRLPKDIIQLSQVVHDLYDVYQHSGLNLSDEALLRCFYRWDIFRRYPRFLSACQVVGVVFNEPKALQKLVEQAGALVEVKLDVAWMRQTKGEAIAAALWDARLQALQQWKDE